MTMVVWFFFLHCFYSLVLFFHWLFNHISKLSARSQSGFGVSYLYHHFYLKPTRCAKGTVESNPEACVFRNDRVRQKHSTVGKLQRAHSILACLFMTWQPLMDCAICYKTANNVMEANPKPYVHCIQKPRLTPVFVRSLFHMNVTTQIHSCPPHPVYCPIAGHAEQ